MNRTSWLRQTCDCSFASGSDRHPMRGSKRLRSPQPLSDDKGSPACAYGVILEADRFVKDLKVAFGEPIEIAMRVWLEGTKTQYRQFVRSSDEALKNPGEIVSRTGHERDGPGR